MSDVVVRAEGLGKRYRIAPVHDRHPTLRDSLARAAQAPLRWASAGRRRPQRGWIWALRDVSFEVRRGEVLGVIGRNGTGKTTLLKVLSRITPPTEGFAEVRGSVGSLLEVGTGFHPELSGRENVYLSGAILGMRRQEINRRFDEIVDFAGIHDFVDTPVKRYSTGMQLRLAFSVAAHLEPEILLVDEVLAVGDAAFQKRCLGKMSHVASVGRTVLFVSHNMAAVTALCSRAALLSSGHVALVGDSATVVARYLSEVEPKDPLTMPTKRRGTGRLRFTSLAVSAGRDADAAPVCSGRSTSFSLDFTSPGRTRLSSVSASLTVLDTHGRALFTCYTNHTDSELHNLPPRGRLVCDIPRLPLAPGRYRVSLWAAVDGEEADLVELAGELEVHQGDFYGSGKLPTSSKFGPLLVPHRWTVDAVGVSET